MELTFIKPEALKTFVAAILSSFEGDEYTIHYQRIVYRAMLKGLIFEYENSFDPKRNYFNEFRECMPASELLGLQEY